ncbi:hypothetical protein HYFRA_00001294 [Hymenoscyphus fraxineus]|uniref:Protein transport protein sec16 n=1 Tax=Hymenoscyphus fraxineus TaxID=746836 RepID=A0A9N9L3Q2_9HELO|nr:hypothetical protein HYFRA_00001294 [Hymenoscyphus fraxineus]
MPSESIAASWHPAMMPNSLADVIETKTSPALRAGALAVEQHQEPIEASYTEASAPVLEQESLKETENLDNQQTIGTSTHNESDPQNPRNAPTSSLSGPGGVDVPQPSEEEKPEFPPANSRQENGHLSTDSFTRTVSQEVNWGEDDDVDPEWNIQTTDTDPFRLMEKSDRTNSFPAVPPLHHPEIVHHDEFLAHSQVEAIMNEVEQEPKDLFGDDTNNDEADFFNQSSAPDSTLGASRPTDPDNVDSPTFGQAYGGDYRQDEDQESQARFEEGLPLVHPEGPRNDSVTPSFLEEEAVEQGDFFSQVGTTEDSATLITEPGPIERKSTFQVMESMHYQPHDQISPAMPEEKVEISQHDSVSATQNGTEDPLDVQLDDVEVDLAEKWKAALADEFLDDDDDDLLPDEEPENTSALDPATLFGSDDEGFLEDVGDQNGSTNTFPSGNQPIVAPVNGHTNFPPGASSSGSKYLPAGANTPPVPQARNTYVPSGPLLTDLSRPAATTSRSTPYVAAASTFPPQQQMHPDRPSVPKAQSFAAQAKGGYSSPYDLPMEVIKPRKRPSMQNISRGRNVTGLSPGVPPPRSSSMYAQAPPPTGLTSSLPPSASNNGSHPNQHQPVAAAQPPRTTSSNSGFFEDLPIASRPKPAPRQSHVSPPNSFGPPATSQFPPNALQPPFQPATQHQPPPHSAGLVAPERVSPYAALPANQASPPSISSRYSPAPPQQPPTSKTAPPPVALSRFSPAPPPSMPRQQSQPYNSSASITSPPVLPHQPRTSSPLAHFERNLEARSYGAEVVNDKRSSSSGYESNLRNNHLPPPQEVDENEQSPPKNYGSLQSPNLQRLPPGSPRSVSQTPPPPQNFGPRSNMSPPKRAPSNYLPQQLSNNINTPPQFAPPQRSQSQSPTTHFTGPRLDPYQRPASVEAQGSPQSPYGPASVPMMPAQGRPRGVSQVMNYVPPTDGREHDPLQRWKGSPVFAWGVGGTIMTSFPKDIPRYGMNQTTPMIMRSPGEVKIRNIKEVDPLPERLTTFPGPLRGKSKKKDVMNWLTAGIRILEDNASYLRMGGHLSHEDKRTEERILLWKILLVFIEHDGVLEGNAVVDKAVRAVLSPGLDSEPTDAAPLYATGADLSGISQPSNSTARADPVDPTAVDQLRKHLLRGEREKAVWEAVDKRLWAHAMLIANTVSKALYKQVAQEFVQKEVKSTGENTESLAALYEVFAGNFEESIDELVPASARAGFQMVSTSNSAGPSKDAMDGLDRWRETLGLVLSNRSIDDVQALKALGKLLSGYGRAEAAHICFLFARSVSAFGGIDDPLSNIVLVGSDHLRQPYEFDKEMEPILLSEVFEYGMSLSSTASVAIAYPHLSIYKLQHASILAEYGYRENALQYCESVASSITSQTRRSPYHHALLISALDDLSKRLKQSPKSEPSSWLSKPSIDKVSGSVWDKLSKFVAGDENDTTGGSTATGGDIFSRIAGDTPNISRAPSNADLYGSYNQGLGINGAIAAVPATRVSSRYAPGRTYTPDQPRSGSLASQHRTSMEERSSGEYQRYEPQRNMSEQRPGSQSASSSYNPSFQPAANSYMPQAQQEPTPPSSYVPFSSSDSPYSAAQYSTPTTEQNPNMFSSPQPINNLNGNQMSTPHTPPEPSYGGQQSSGYEPPASSGYEPPTSSYTPYEPADEPDSPVETKPKKKSFMDDDYDDGMTSNNTSAPREKTKAEKDREADEAFRKAAEEDAKRASAAPVKKGWGLGGWFGGGKKDTADAPASNKPIRAKLGEASSFYYDPDLKRWINKKGGDTAPTASATPPPPKAGPPRTSSVGPPSTRVPLPASRAVSDAGRAPRSFSQDDGPSSDAPPALAPPAFAPMSRSLSNTSAGRSPSAPPSRPGTSMSNASSIDDLLGPATGGSRKGAAKKKKGRGYIDVMGEKPS